MDLSQLHLFKNYDEANCSSGLGSRLPMRTDLDSEEEKMELFPSVMMKLWTFAGFFIYVRIITI